MRVLLFAFTGVLLTSSLAEAAIDRAVLRGTHTSACSPIVLQGRRSFSRLALRFVGKAYASSETLFSDPKCEISVLQTTSHGIWEIRRGEVLNLRVSRMQLRPLDPRLADRYDRSRSCGKKWENGVPNDILGTACARAREAEYFVGPSPSGQSLVLHECEGRRKIGPGCTRYGMARTPEPTPAKNGSPSLLAEPKSLKPLRSRPVSRN